MYLSLLLYGFQGHAVFTEHLVFHSVSQMVDCRGSEEWDGKGT